MAPRAVSAVAASAVPQAAGFASTRVLLREDWEYQPSPAHRSLVLMLYRRILKELMEFKSIRKRSITTYVRLCFRRRSHATEKALIDECIEEARRGVYILDKHNQFAKTKEYKYDDMFLPKDTGQDVAGYMEDVFDPVAARGQFGELGADAIAPNEGVQSMKGAQNPALDKTLWGAASAKDIARRKEMAADLSKQNEGAQPSSFRPPPPPSSTRS